MPSSSPVSHCPQRLYHLPSIKNFPAIPSSTTLSNVPHCITLLIFLYSSSCPPSSPTNLSIIPTPVPGAKSHGLALPRVICLSRTPLAVQLEGLQRHPWMGRAKARGSQEVGWGRYYTVADHKFSLFMGAVPSFPLFMFPSCALFPFISLPSSLGLDSLSFLLYA